MWNGRNHRSTEHALARYVADAPPEKGNVRGKRKTKKADKIGVGVGIGIGVEKEIGMAFGHEKLGQRGYAVGEEPGEYRTAEIDPDTDSDPDPE
jgi:hypothetical protein